MNFTRNFVFLSAGCLMLLLGSCWNSSEKKLEWQFEIVDLDKVSISRNNTRYLCGNTSIPIRFMGPKSTMQDAPGAWIIQLIDYRGNKISEEMYESEFRVEKNEWSVYKLIQIPNLQQARKIEINAAWINGSDIRVKKLSYDRLEWKRIYSGFVIQDVGDVIFDKGWFPPEKQESGQLLWWSKGESDLVCSQTIVPLIFSCNLFFPMQCFENHVVNLSILQDNDDVINQNIENDKFPFWSIIPSCKNFDMRPDYTLVRFICSETFSPKQCHGNDDLRELSFSVSEARMKSYLPLKGFDLDIHSPEATWIQPEATFVVPVTSECKALFLEGWRDVDSVPEPQTIQFYSKNSLIYSSDVKKEHFCLKIPLENSIPSDGSLEIKLYVTPFFFPDDDTSSTEIKPHAIAIQNIIAL